MKKEKKFKDTSDRMSYETYAFLKSLLEAEAERLERDFQMACFFVEKGSHKGGKSGVEKAHEIFSAENSKLNNMKEELHKAAQATYRDHPNKGMREFWGIEE